MASKHFTGTAALRLCLLLPLVAGCENAGSAHPMKPVTHQPATSQAKDSKLAPQAQSILPRSEITWSYPTTKVGPMQVVVSLPARHAGEKFPVLLAFHGRGEALKGPRRGARGWLDDYRLGRAIDELKKPPLEPELFLGFAHPERLLSMNQSLRTQPYAGLIVVMPYTPDTLGGEDAVLAARTLGAFVTAELLPRIYRETPALGTPESTGIDGVSLGGRAAWAIGLASPEKFGVVGGLQAAFDAEEGESLERYTKAALEKNPRLTLRLLSSEQDYYLASLSAISARLKQAAVPHRFDVVRGTHSYSFNRGPGAYEMLLFHDRALRGHAPTP